ncbi:RNA-binding protein [Wickerhamomyces ciferrii]|uniref:20S-pre-rRNA D-site endonuclease NOB1 n=1 Tax=Wickerhamomyces ciferrii (strain ATCC 14091 / BCRC 22168 / CBS 111 / JCM 3599 / NBRC 0793 / NRRL Y-1031 F-60-10) TaxID=1206466 RepID=K0KHV7_WICCF|nr:RNA-binding protein [Wickerhamomyces ciferrii]CCH44765.1 RNA-binding protein [Wickerhamomyces ciferrii]
MSDTIASLNEPKVQCLVLDATPLITQHVSTLQQHAKQFYTTPTVFKEIRDETARRNLELWGENLIQRHPKPEFIKKVSDFAKLTGDFQVLSANDIHIIALTYELECELNHGDWRLRKYPGEVLQFNKSKKSAEASESKENDVKEDPIQNNDNLEESKEESKESNEEPQPEVKKKQRRRGGKKQRAKREAALQAELDDEEQSQQSQEQSQDDTLTETTNKLESLNIKESNESSNQELTQDYDDEEDDGDWIDQDNLLQEMIKDSGEKIEKQTESITKIKVALSTQDFACQNVSLQIGLNLMNTLSGLQIKRVRNYMLRCYACFRIVPFPKDGKPKHFCSYCGGQTILRCAVSVDARTGEVTPHLKANFEWHKRGDRYSIASPLSKNSQKRLGKKGFVHNKSNKQKEYQEPILREDQKEYSKAIKDDDWLRRQNEKVLNDWIGGGSADNVISPFSAQGFRSSGVKVGKGRFVNSSRRR